MYEHLLRPPVRFESADEFLVACVGYFRWCEENPLLEDQVFQYQGAIIRGEKARMRPFTKRGLATHLGIPESRLAAYEARGDEWAEAMEMVEQVIYTQKFEGGATGLLNSGFIARDLGMADRSEVTGRNGGPLQMQDVTEEERLICEAHRLGLDPAALGLGGGAEEAPTAE